MRKIMSVILTAACCMACCGGETESFVTQLLRQYPQARLLDIYKSCFQDYMGPEHLVNDTASARSYLEQELAMTEGETLPSWYYEPCGSSGNHVRVSLRAVHDGLITAEGLLSAFVTSANADHPSVEQWSTRWQSIIRTIDEMHLALPHYAEDKRLIEDALAQGKYAISHSPEYRQAYSPHYRIVERKIFERALRPLLP